MPLYSDTFSDFDFDFIAHPVTKDIVKVVDDNAIKQSIEYLLDLDYYDSPFQHEKGSRVKRLLFDPMGVDTVIELREAIEEVLDKYEPRITVHDVEVDPDYDNALYNVKIVFKIINNINLSSIEFVLTKVN